MLTDTSDKIRVDGYVGTWYVIETATFGGERYFLVEHEKYGDETAHLILDEDGRLVLGDVWNGFDDLEEALEDEDFEPEWKEAAR